MTQTAQRHPAAWLAVLLALGGCTLFQPSHNHHVPPPAKTVDLSRYLGHWYEMARYDSSFETGCTHSSADYTALPHGRIGVVNTCRRHGRTIAVHGRAIVVAHSGNAKLKVSFFGPFYFGTYWVLDHGPDYQWSIVGEPTGGYLWILTRARTPAPALRAALVAQTAALGYDTGKLVFTPQ